MTAKDKGIITGGSSILFYPALMNKFGLAGALIIQQVHYWCVTNRENKEPLQEGHSWMFMSVAQWVDQLEVVGRSNIVTTISNLEKQGVLVSSTFNKHAYDRTKWYRVGYEKLALLLSDASKTVDFLASETGLKIGPKPHAPPHLPESGICQNLAGGMPKSGRGYATGRHDDTKNNYKKNEKNKPDVQEHVVKTTKRIVMTGRGSKPTTAAEVLEQFKASKASAPPVAKVSPTSMELIWKRKVSQLEGVSFVKSFTTVQKGQCKHYINAVGQSLAFPVLMFVLDNWIAFTKVVEQNAGLKKTPMLPDLGFLLKYSDHAVNQFLKTKPIKGESKVQPPASAPVKGKITIKRKTPTPVQLIAPATPEKEDDLVDAEFLANWKKGKT